MSKFAKVKLKKCATFINGMAFKPIDWDVKGLPIVRIQNLTGTNKNFNYYSKEYNPKFEINNGDLLISWSASLGVFIWNGSKAILNQHIFKVVFDKIEINKKYFYFCILDVLEEMSEKTHGSAMRHITKGDFDNIEIPIPPLQEQERIVGILDESFANIDESIKILEQDLLNLDELMQSALQKAFNPLKDDTKENYQLPQGWEWKSLGEICEIIGGGTPSKQIKQYWENGTIKWATVRDMNTETIEDTEFRITNLGLDNSSTNIINQDFILIATRVGLGKVCLVKDTLAINQDLKGILPHKSLNKKYLFYFFKKNKDFLIENGIGATVKGVSVDFIKSLQIPLPSLQEQKQIASYLDELSLNIKALKENYKTQIKDYEELKKSLLKKAFEGRL